MRALRFYSYCESSGYGLAAIAYVRALVNAGMPVQWRPLRRVDSRVEPWEVAQYSQIKLLTQSTDDESLADLHGLLARTGQAVKHDVVLVHTVPEHWNGCIEAGKRNIAYTAWETDTLPSHWQPLLQHVSRVLVPCVQNQSVFARHHTDVRVVPHIRRHAWAEYSSHELGEFRKHYGVSQGDCVFYCIGSWDARKGMFELIDSFCSAFGSTDRVALIIKSSTIGSGPSPRFATIDVKQAVQAQLAALATTLNKTLPRVIVIAHSETSGAQIDLLHQAGDVFITLSHGEGWGLGAFEAAQLGKPVIAAVWAGLAEFLPTTGETALPYTAQPCPPWPPELPSYWPSQRWATVEISDAARAMQRTAANLPRLQNEARARVTALHNQFAEPLVGQRLIAALQ
jgi:glycosyltransferase involved in cell wall biosynthesis